MQLFTIKHEGQGYYAAECEWRMNNAWQRVSPLFNTFQGATNWLVAFRNGKVVKNPNKVELCKES